ncbi:6-carboxytetrahydropterin synthase [Halioxenophilus sp. WMMB6]|uniref:6-carboxytetrahydropterin synthase n=1 Tax=Halioxenophilus sp. WMMB6 TaxID=3073815 RepID=UPI00295F1089|nr:6-carboxytetrahydropterin synthase [Halioxenophilus sp. WMMB6]
MYLFVDQLTNVDFSYLDPARGLVGETWLANFGLEGDLDEAGMICDFGQIKALYRRWLDSQLDHRLLVPTLAPELQLNDFGEEIELSWRSLRGTIKLRVPAQAVALIPAAAITPQACATWVVAQLRGQLPGAIARVDLEFSVEAIAGSYYHYSHGLKKHTGNCQRIAHGHRSAIAIWLDGERSAEQEADWSQRWADVYLATRDDLIDEGASEYTFGYESAQGRFQIRLPKGLCYLLECDTTVENLAQHLCQEIKAQQPTAAVRVKAFEGIGKGAIACA